MATNVNRIARASTGSYIIDTFKGNPTKPWSHPTLTRWCVQGIIKALWGKALSLITEHPSGYRSVLLHLKGQSFWQE
ncbi:MAG: hypothetical protein HRT36_04955 [Alphaproteobacteria bacterium]|nr:hypothetical protein [Alphaproteobacteria bacterium]